jgi:hypothetical protein
VKSSGTISNSRRLALRAKCRDALSRKRTKRQDSRLDAHSAAAGRGTGMCRVTKRQDSRLDAQSAAAGRGTGMCRVNLHGTKCAFRAVFQCRTAPPERFSTNCQGGAEAVREWTGIHHQEKRHVHQARVREARFAGV